MAKNFFVKKSNCSSMEMKKSFFLSELMLEIKFIYNFHFLL